MNLQDLQMALRKSKEEISRLDSDISKTEKEIAKLDGKLGNLEEKKEKKVEVRTVLVGLKETWKRGIPEDRLNKPYYTFLIRRGREREQVSALPKEWSDSLKASSEIVIIPADRLVLAKCPQCGKSNLLIRRCELVEVSGPKGEIQVEEEEFLVICCGETRTLKKIPGWAKLAPF